MTLTTWLLFASAVLVLTVTPGPSVFMSISVAVQHGPRRALIAALGSTCAISCLMLASMLGLGGVLAASELGFSVLKWLGAGYLAYLGISALLSTKSSFVVPQDGNEKNGSEGSIAKLFVQGLLVGASNPKALLFFGALFPQFINPSAPQLEQFLILGSTFVCFEMFWLTVYAFSAGRARGWLQQPRRALAFNRLTGIVFLAAAGLVAASKKSTG